MSKIDKIISANNQEHLFEFINSMDNIELEAFFKDIEKIDFTLINTDNKNKCINYIDFDISPVDVLKISECQNKHSLYYKIGIDALFNNKVAALLLAGGMGSRLGSTKPKGMFKIGIETDLCLFQLHIENIKKVSALINKKLYLFIMVSNENCKETTEFFNLNDYFGYDAEYIKFLYKMNFLP